MMPNDAHWFTLSSWARNLSHDLLKEIYITKVKGKGFICDIHDSGQLPHVYFSPFLYSVCS